MRAPHHEAAFAPDAGSTRIPLRAIALTVAGMVAIGALCTLAVRNDEAQKKKDKRTHCVEVPAPVVSALQHELSLTGGRILRAWSASRAGTDAAARAGDWFVSIELGTPDLAARTTGDIATWVTSDVDGAPAAGPFESVERNARRFSRWPASAKLDINRPGIIESRWCAKDADPNAGD